MEVQTIPHVYPRRKSPLHLETQTRALRSSLWVSLFLSQELDLHGLQDALTRTLRDVDRLIEEIELAG
jgi:hypothetical protein